MLSADLFASLLASICQQVGDNSNICALLATKPVLTTIAIRSAPEMHGQTDLTQ